MADASRLARPECAALEQADWHGLEHGPAVVYLLAHARREAFYIDVATNLDAIQEVYDNLRQRQVFTLPESQWAPPQLVWFEPAADAALAQARVGQIRALPHAWQRRLVAAMNPAWFDLYTYVKGYPVKIVVGEQRMSWHDDRIA